MGTGEQQRQKQKIPILVAIFMAIVGIVGLTEWIKHKKDQGKPKTTG